MAAFVFKFNKLRGSRGLFLPSNYNLIRRSRHLEQRIFLLAAMDSTKIKRLFVGKEIRFQMRRF